MLLAVALVFLLLTLPNSIYFVLELTYGFNKPPTENDHYQWLRYRRLNILTVIMFQLSDLQHATNFFIYLLTSDKFRRTVIMICTLSAHFLSSLLNCCRQDKAGSSSSSSSFQNHYSVQRYDKNSMPYRFSASEMSTMSPNRRSASIQQPVSNCRTSVSKPATIIESL
jgi:hypothetical protein